MFVSGRIFYTVLTAVIFSSDASRTKEHQFLLQTSKNTQMSSLKTLSPPDQPLQAIKVVDDVPGQSDNSLDSDMSIAVSFDANKTWKVDEQSLVSAALNRRYGIQSSVLDALKCKCTKSGDKESLNGRVDHTVSCDCL